MQAIQRIGAALLLAGAASGCVSLNRGVTEFSTDYNRAIADSRNSTVLLNIMRASRGEPTHWTALSQVEATLTYRGSANLALSGLSMNDDAGASLGVEGSVAPTFTVVPLNTQEFATGILQPVTPEVVRLLLTQGWDPSLVAALLIQKVECEGGGEAQHRVSWNAVGHVSDDGHGFYASPVADVEMWFVDSDDAAAQRFTVELSGSELTQFLASDLDRTLEIERSETIGDRTRLHLRRLPAQDVIRFSLPRESFACPDATPEDGAIPARVHLRSAEGVVAFLGEIVGSGQDFGYLASHNGVLERRTLFSPRRGGGGDVVVSHRGEDWSLYADPTGRDQSLRVIALINQLVALQTSQDSLRRSSATVRAR